MNTTETIEATNTNDARANAAGASATASAATAAAAPPAEPATSVAREVVAGLLGIGVALGCVLPPLLHLLTGPLGPFIAGFVVAHHVRPGPRGRAIIALEIGVGLAGIGATAAFGIAHFSGPKGPPAWFPDVDTISLILLGVFAYATALAALGARFGAGFRSEKSA